MINLPEKFKNRVAISPNEAAEIMGIHRSTVYRHIMPYVLDGTIASRMIGGRRRIILSSFLVWLEGQAGSETQEAA